MIGAIFGAALLLTSVAADDVNKPVFAANFDSAQALVQIGGKGKLEPRGNTKVIVETAAPLMEGSGGFLRITRPVGDDNGPAGVRLVPQSPEHWLNTWYQDAGDADVLHGAIDLLYRQNSAHQDGSTFRLDFPAATNTDGIRLVLTTNGPNIFAVEVVRRIGGQSQNAAVIGTRFKFEANVVYHIALTFQPGSQPGTTVGRLYIERAGQPIKPGDTTPTAVLPAFKLDPEGRLSSSFHAGDNTSIFGVLNLAAWKLNQEVVVDLDRIRIWKGIPTEFGPGQP